ncbi:MAG: hypothetical protein AB7G39_03375 [Alphaproteobacteria bacterium]
MLTNRTHNIPLAVVAMASGLRVNRIEKLIHEGRFRPANDTVPGVGRVWTEYDIIRLSIVGALADVADFSEVLDVLRRLEAEGHLQREDPIFAVLCGPWGGTRRIELCGSDRLLECFQGALNVGDAGRGIHKQSVTVIWLTKIAGHALLRLNEELARRARLQAQRDACAAWDAVHGSGASEGDGTSVA